ncbi:hypothetical protein MNBD_GAMMA17-1959 [hydrothermal vent metagenome]|uniref:FOG: HEAT repeat n=1 Tax=hydrothermal vent metagenome TaxID=652676 RepID=A0A3B0ZBM3_9ZZZZ
MSNPYRSIFERHVTNAAFLWIQRSAAVYQPNYSPEALAQLEQRINRHLTGLLLEPELAWDICEEALVFEKGGEIFITAMMAFANEDSEKTERAMKAGFVNAGTFKGLVSALGWLPEEKGRLWVQKGLASNELDDNLLAIATCSIIAHDPGESLFRLVKRGERHPEHPLLIRCLRLIGELKRVDLATVVNKAATADNADIRFWGIWSSILLGNHANALKLEAYIRQTNPWQQKAIQLAFRVLSDDVADLWINHLLDQPGQQRQSIKAIAANGRIDAISHLIIAMQDDTLACVAGDAFSLLTGIDLKQQQLTRPQPQWDDSLDDIDSDITFEDAKLPWPNADKIAALWQQRAADFEGGHRYFLGQAINTAHLSGIVASGYQRHPAALELALLEPLHPLSNTRAISQDTQ